MRSRERVGACLLARMCVAASLVLGVPAVSHAAPPASHQPSKSASDKGKTASRPASGKKKASKNARSASASETPEEQRSAAKAEMGLVLEAFYTAQYGTALAHCRKALALYSDTTIELTCVKLMDLNGLTEAAYEMLMQHAGEDDNPQRTFDRCMLKATLETRLARYADAEATYETCHAPTPEFASMVRGNQADLLMIQGRPSEALAMFLQANEIVPTNSFVYFGAAVAAFRAGDRARAESMFLQGLQYDPNLMFFEDSFFEPDGEADFHHALMSAFSHRYDEAIFYLERYLTKEARAPYHALGASFLEEIRSMRTGHRVAAWPVLINRVARVAWREGYAAFADATNNAVWVLDTERGIVRQRLTDVEDVRSMAFDKNTGNLRVLTRTVRYELDPSDENSGFYYWQNDVSAHRWINLTSDGQYGLVTTPDGVLEVVPFIGSAPGREIVSLPVDVTRVNMTSDARTVFWELQKVSHIADVEKTRLTTVPFRDVRLTDVAGAGNVFAVGTVRGTIVFNASGEIIARYGAPEGQVTTAVALDATGRWLLTVSGMLAELWAL